MPLTKPTPPCGDDRGLKHTRNFGIRHHPFTPLRPYTTDAVPPRVVR